MAPSVSQTHTFPIDILVRSTSSFPYLTGIYELCVERWALPCAALRSVLFVQSSQNLDSNRTMAVPPIYSLGAPLPSDSLSRLPTEVLRRILHFLLSSNHPVILGIDDEWPIDYSSGMTPSVLRCSQYIYTVGIEVLYGRNTFTTSSAATSAEFDKQILRLPSGILRLLRHIKLEIDWIDELWSKLPLLASALGRMQGLRSLEITITSKAQKIVTGARTEGLASRPMESRGAHIRVQGQMHEAILKAEKRVLKNLVLELRALRIFRLRGFIDRQFATELENWVANGRRSS